MGGSTGGKLERGEGVEFPEFAGQQTQLLITAGEVGFWASDPLSLDSALQIINSRIPQHPILKLESGYGDVTPDGRDVKDIFLSITTLDGKGDEITYHVSPKDIMELHWNNPHADLNWYGYIWREIIPRVKLAQLGR